MTKFLYIAHGCIYEVEDSRGIYCELYTTHIRPGKCKACPMYTEHNINDNEEGLHEADRARLGTI